MNNKNITASDRNIFLQWLRDNGAKFPKLKWPVIVDSDIGMCGAIATSDIAANEPMIIIPEKLFISEKSCLESIELKQIYQENHDLFPRDDMILSFYLMHESIKGEKSFYYPYLKILPHPDTVQDWTDSELKELQDENLVKIALHRNHQINYWYNQIFDGLNEKYPNKFSKCRYTFEDFQFAWNTVQARTFGRRLPWTALIPFADCLNHSNVSTKYDYLQSDSSIMEFRLYPSGNNTYYKDHEVYNSYGKRSNSQLLLDYGFVLENNEWDYFEMNIDVKQRAAQRENDVVNSLTNRSTRKKCIRVRFVDRIDELILAYKRYDKCEIELETAFGAPISLSSELKVLSAIKHDYEQVLSLFATCIEQDEFLTKGKVLPWRMRCALFHRLSRKRIILHQISIIDGTIKFISDLLNGTVNETFRQKSNSVYLDHLQSLMT